MRDLSPTLSVDTAGGPQHSAAMYRLERAADEPRGVAGNARLTGAVAAALLVLLAAEGATIPLHRPAAWPAHLHRHAADPAGAAEAGQHRLPLRPLLLRQRPPTSARDRRNLALRLLAPGVVLTTLALFGTGVALLFAGPPSNTLIFAHKLSFIAWVALMTIHVLGHLLEVPALALAGLAAQRPARGAAGRCGNCER